MVQIATRPSPLLISPPLLYVSLIWRLKMGLRHRPVVAVVLALGRQGRKRDCHGGEKAQHED